MIRVIIGFSRPRKFKIGSLAIRLWQGCTPYSHVYLSMYHPIARQDIVYQASHGCVNAISKARFVEQNIITNQYIVELELERVKSLVQYCVSELGAPYGFIGLIKIVLRRALRKIFKIKGDGSKSYHCSEFVHRAMPDLFEGDPDFIEPKDLHKVLQVRSLGE